ncbi:MAG: DNA replication and repair protein RecF [Oscillospiraceae bacterium]|nr:DNA replication and repair protein RecF [Oscillospiraceae bacterium]
MQSFEAQNFRNLAQAEFLPCPGVNVIFGENGQGKTNLIEALWLFTGCRSFRGADNTELLTHGQSTARLALTFCSNAREQTASLALTQKKRLLHLNGFAEPTPRRMLGVFPAVAFTPATLSLAQGGPGERRRFIDVALSMLTPGYAVRLSKYLKALAQRNALLRQAAPSPEMLEVWDAALAQSAAALTNARLRWLAQLTPLAQEFYAGISAAREVLRLRFAPLGEGETAPGAEVYLAALRRARPTDQRCRMTTIGPHRDDLVLTLDEKPLRIFGSQGQQRSAALALKLAEATVLRAATAEQPIALLDDVLSELDACRQRDLLRYLEGWQVFLTCCEPSHTLHGQAGKVFLMAGGKSTAHITKTL